MFICCYDWIFVVTFVIVGLFDLAWLLVWDYYVVDCLGVG